MSLCLSTFADTNFARAMLMAGVLASACAVLSVIVVLRRWAFIGEGISHAGFGGVGTGWLLSLGLPILRQPDAVFAVALLFCLLTAVGIGWVTRRESTGEFFGADSAIGIFLSAGLAWGFAALAIYKRYHGNDSVDWERYLFGNIDLVPGNILIAGTAISLLVFVCVIALFKEIITYAFNPLIAEVSGVRVGDRKSVV